MLSYGPHDIPLESSDSQRLKTEHTENRLRRFHRKQKQRHTQQSGSGRVNNQHPRITCSLMHKTTHQCGGRAASIPIPNQKNDIFSCPIPFLQPYRHDPHHRPPAITPPFMVTVVSSTSSWLRNRRIRYLFLILCSPLLLLLFCAALPFICVAELCLRRGIWRKLVRGSGDDERLRRCEEGYCRCGESEGVGLLQRYLEDQLLLVGSVYECGDEEDDEDYQFKGVEDVENPGTCTTPLLG